MVLLSSRASASFLFLCLARLTRAHGVPPVVIHLFPGLQESLSRSNGLHGLRSKLLYGLRHVWQQPPECYLLRGEHGLFLLLIFHP
eukprot:scaffold4488_cov358-Prasinococcus_capsulatus_cf.AAC.12